MPDPDIHDVDVDLDDIIRVKVVASQVHSTNLIVRFQIRSSVFDLPPLDLPRSTVRYSDRHTLREHFDIAWKRSSRTYQTRLEEYARGTDVSVPFVMFSNEISDGPGWIDASTITDGTLDASSICTHIPGDLIHSISARVLTGMIDPNSIDALPVEKIAGSVHGSRIDGISADHVSHIDADAIRGELSTPPPAITDSNICDVSVTKIVASDTEFAPEWPLENCGGRANESALPPGTLKLSGPISAKGLQGTVHVGHHISDDQITNALIQSLDSAKVTGRLDGRSLGFVHARKLADRVDARRFTGSTRLLGSIACERTTATPTASATSITCDQLHASTLAIDRTVAKDVTVNETGTVQTLTTKTLTSPTCSASETVVSESAPGWYDAYTNDITRLLKMLEIVEELTETI